MAELILGIDIGTTSLKTAVFDYTGQKISSAIMEYSLLTPELNVVEAPCDIYMESIRACLSAMKNAFIQMSGVFAELELRIIRERVRSGMANAKAKGAKIGRPQATVDDIPAVFLRHYPAYKKKQLNVSELARVCDLSRTTVYKYIDLLEG